MRLRLVPTTGCTERLLSVMSRASSGTDSCWHGRSVVPWHVLIGPRCTISTTSASCWSSKLVVLFFTIWTKKLKKYINFQISSPIHLWIPQDWSSFGIHFNSFLLFSHTQCLLWSQVMALIIRSPMLCLVPWKKGWPCYTCSVLCHGISDGHATRSTMRHLSV
jgi:hypothetical protein